MKSILDSGVSTFVCLQGELPPQEFLTPKGKSGFIPYKSVAEQLRGVQKSRSKNRQDLQDLDFVHFPITDLGVPDPNRLLKLVEELEQRLDKGEFIYLHCWGGRGRAGTVAACLLMKMFDMDSERALNTVQNAFNTRMEIGGRSPETDEQKDFVRSFADILEQQ